ncbi:hypothetical protein TNCV_4523281 [Trichonephila clavipes]|nr:hypothetical protein TNCV_4523281 [Trichonephila clavipes]
MKTRIPKKYGHSSPLDEDDLIRFILVNGNKEIDNDEVENEVQLLTADLIREGLKFATSMEQRFLPHDPDIEHANVSMLS